MRAKAGMVLQEVREPTRWNRHPKCKQGVLEIFQKGDSFNKGRQDDPPVIGTLVLRLLSEKGNRCLEVLDWHDFMSDFWKPVSKKVVS